MKWRIIGIASILVMFLTLVFGFSSSDLAQSSSLKDFSDSGKLEETHKVTLITGDKVFIEQYSDGRRAINIEPAERDGHKTNFETIEIDEEDVYVIPEDVAQFFGEELDRELFNVTRLIDQGYDDEETDEIPLIIILKENVSVQSLDTQNSIFSDSIALSSIESLAVKASKNDTNRMLDTLFIEKDNVLQGTQLFQNNIKEVRLDRKVNVELEDSVPQIGATKVWESGYDGSGIKVAVLDTGIDETHPDLEGKVTKRANFTEDDSANDLHGHGTHVASTIAGSGEASDGLRQGVAQGVSLINGKVLDESGNGVESDIIRGMEWAAEEASIINMSLGTKSSTDGTDPLSQAIDELTEANNVLFVVSAGNKGPRDMTVTAPGTSDSALTVGSVDKFDVLASTSSIGPRLGDNAIKPDITAPGVDIIAARADGTSMGIPIDSNYTQASGTSMASPHVAGSAALLMDKWEGEERDFSSELLKSSLVSPSKPNQDNTVYEQGAGRLDLESIFNQEIYASPSSLNAGTFEEEDNSEPFIDEITYHNMSEEEMDINLSATIESSDVEVIPDDLITFSEDIFTVNPGESKTIEVTLDHVVAKVGLYGGYIVAEDPSEEVKLHTPIGFNKEPELYNLTIKGIDRDGEKTEYRSTVGVINVKNKKIFDDTRIPLENGEATVRVPEGNYSVIGTIHTIKNNAFANTNLVGNPEMYIDKDTTVKLDARDAKPITRSGINERTETQNFEVGYYRKSEEWGSYSSTSHHTSDKNVYATPMEGAETGKFSFLTDWELISPKDFKGKPYFYKLNFVKPYIPEDLNYTVDPRDLARVEVEYYDQNPGEEFKTALYAWVSGFAASSFENELQIPMERTEYYTTEENIYYQRRVIPQSSGFDFRQPRTKYKPGETYKENWMKQPIHSGALIGNPPLEDHQPVYREGNTLTMELPEYLDADKHYGQVSDVSSIRLYQNDELIDVSDRARGTFKLNSGDAQIRMELTTTNEHWSLFSTNIHTNWTFYSKEPDEGQNENVPLLTLDYDLNLGLNNAALRPDEVETGNDVFFEVYHQPGAKTQPIEGANVWVSYDDDYNWQKINDVEQLGNGKFRAGLIHDDAPEGSGFVSLRVKAWDVEDNSVEQEIIRAYRLPITAANMKTHVIRFEEEGAFEGDSAARLLKMHLTTVSLFEKQENATKVVKHMKSLYDLLDYQLDNGMISEEAYNFLKLDTGSVLEYWK